MTMKKLIEEIKKRRDERFLRRLERVMRENTLDVTLKVTGEIWSGCPKV